jgi:short-subunit dehydrogenase
MVKTKNNILITGASGGIGIETCKLLDKEENQLLLIDINQEHLEKLANELKFKPKTFVCDVSNYNKIKELILSLLNEYKSIDTIICLAGIIRPGLFDHLSIENLRIQMEVNFFGVINTIYPILPNLKEKKQGKIIIVSSLAGIVPAPKHNMYVASKFALRGLIQTLYLELKPFNIQITNVMPDAILTPMLKYTATQDASPLAFANYPLPASDVAEAIQLAMKKDKMEIYVPYFQGLLARIAQFFVGFIPFLWPKFEEKGLKNKKLFDKKGLLK